MVSTTQHGEEIDAETAGSPRPQRGTGKDIYIRRRVRSCLTREAGDPSADTDDMLTSEARPATALCEALGACRMKGSRLLKIVSILESSSPTLDR